MNDITIIAGIEIPDMLLYPFICFLFIMFLGGLLAAGAPARRRYR